MAVLIYILTIVFGIVCFRIIRTKRYKIMPFISLIMFICFVSCGLKNRRMIHETGMGFI